MSSKEEMKKAPGQMGGAPGRRSRVNPNKIPQGGGRGHGGRGGAGGKVRIEKDTIPTLKRLFSYFGQGYMGLFALACLCMLANAFVSVQSSLFLRTLIDDNIAPILAMATPVYDGLLKAILKMACIYAIGVVANFSNTMLMRVVSQGVIRKIRTDLFNHLQTLPIKYFDTHPYGDVMSRFTNDVDSMRNVLSQSIPQVLSSCVTIVTVLSSMIMLSIPLTLLVFCFVAVQYIITITIGGKSAMYFRQRQAAIGEVNAFVEEMMNGQKVIKVFCHEDETKVEFDQLNDTLREKTAKANTFGSIIMPIMGNLANIQYVVVAMVGGWLALRSGSMLTLGTLVSFMNLSRSFSQPVSMISQQINTVVMALAGAKRVFTVMDEASEVDEGNITLIRVNKAEDGTLTPCEERTEHWAWKVPEADGSFKLVELKGDVRLKDVDFGYVPEKQILYDVNLFAKPGQKIAFVGSTGAGKTTITNLINRFYDIQSGQIIYDGLDIMNIKKDDLRHSMGIVLQDVNLFTGTIADNIRYGRPDATDEEVIAAAKLANAHSFIERLPEGYNTVISGTGSQLSQGQCQLLSIARCAVANPPVMIMDEATSSVDTRTETLIQNGMDSLMADRTTFVIAHRLSTVQNSNAIMVLEKGRIIERGNHDELIAQGGRYYQLYTGKSAKA